MKILIADEKKPLEVNVKNKLLSIFEQANSLVDLNKLEQLSEDDLVLFTVKDLKDQLTHLKLDNINVAEKCLVSRTHKGIQLLSVKEVDYLQAENKYVIAYYANGSMIIDESLNLLEQEFSDFFIRIHRKALVAKEKLVAIKKDEGGKWFVRLSTRDEKLPVSRRQLASVRKFFN